MFAVMTSRVDGTEPEVVLGLTLEELERVRCGDFLRIRLDPTRNIESLVLAAGSTEYAVQVALANEGIITEAISIPVPKV